MINLFNINNHRIDTSKFNHYLHGSIVSEFEDNFCEYVGAKYACSINIATNAIFLSLLNKNQYVKVPSMIPPVVCNAIVTSGNKLGFSDDVDWVGDSYILHKFKDYKIIDSAQKVDNNQFKKEAGVDTELLAMPNSAANDAAQNVAATFVARQYIVCDQECTGADVIGDNV